MNGLGDIKAFVARWIDSVAAAIVGVLTSFRTRKSVQVIEEDNGTLRDPGRRRARHAVRAAVRADHHGRRPDRLAASRECRGDAARQSCGTGAEGIALPVPSARAAAARDRISRRRGARADRPADAVGRERCGVRLEPRQRPPAPTAWW